MLLAMLFLPLFSLFAQGVRGVVKDNNGEPLPYASIYVAELRDGASTNMQGRYEIRLAPGTYTLKVQYLGFKSQELKVQIEGAWIEQNFKLEEQVQVLRQVEIESKRKEDQAYTIMRKAIAKRKYHQLQYNSYQMKVYIKGTGQVTNVPFFLKKKLKDEGLVTNQAYTSESVSLIKFNQPDKIEEKVISVRSTGENSGAAPGPYIVQSFYNEKIITAISPLSRTAFTYYKFRFEGSFFEGNHEINKIRVIPRSKGDDVFEGHIYIIDDLWAIHSLDLQTTMQGFKVSIKQNYAEVAPKLMMPITHQLMFSGSVMGFAGEYRYLASCSDYQVELNPDLVAETEIIDEKIDEVPVEVKGVKVAQNKDEVVELLGKEEQMTKKQFRKMIDQYEKEALKEQDEPEVVSERTYTVDSMAYKQDAAYWEAIRPVPLSEKEIKGYQRDDSLARVETAKKEKVSSGSDSTKVKKKFWFNPRFLLLGEDYRLSGNTELKIDPTITQIYYNTVEGFNINMSATLKHQWAKQQKSLEFSPVIRYGIASEDFYASSRLSYNLRALKVGDIQLGKAFYLEGGKFVSQFNEDNPIHPHINTISSLIFKSNFMKIYEKSYTKAGFNYQPTVPLKLSGSLEWASRQQLYDQTGYSFYAGESRTYSSNTPANIELQDTSFPQHEALVVQAAISYRPGLTYSVRNGKKTPRLDKAPELTLMYRKGIKGVLSSDVDFDQLELGLNHGYTLGVSGRLEFELHAGSFLNNRNMHFMDYKHFDGNRTILSTLRPAGGYRLLDYYNYSTNGSYFAGHTHYQFRKFLLTQLPMLRFTGLKENLFVNYLKTEASPHYYELGYSLDNVFRIFRIEAAASFHNGSLQEIAPRIGIATILKFN